MFIIKSEIRNDAQFGRILWVTDEKTEIIATLDVGIRIIHISAYGKENLFYRQPEDLSDGLYKSEGWRIFGGHRLWFAPESEKSYYPDQEPVTYTLEDNAVCLTQKTDLWMGLRKSVRLEFMLDGKIKVRWGVENTGDETICGALWGIHTLCGGIGIADFSNSKGELYRPNRAISLWRDTNLNDERISFEGDKIIVKHKLGGSYFKIGFYSQKGFIHHENLGQVFDIEFPVFPMEQCPDGGSNVEIWTSRHCMELEVLGPLVSLAPHNSTQLEVFWDVRCIDS